MRTSESKERFGPVMRKVLLLLQAGVALSLSGSPRAYFRVLTGVSREWKRINQRSLREAIQRLYESKLVGIKENSDGTVRLELMDGGKKKVLEYNLDTLKVQKPERWDKLWRVVIFDIPEERKQGRYALASMLKRLGFYPMQKSVFIHPFECKDEIDFIIEVFRLKPYVCFLRVKETDIDLHLKSEFGIS
ncbi:MAG: hypothetical protein HYW65_01295 [Candidatus Liptonbacteria bacterium]|nr:hypothetical protein [Candidatus Liptonbacteria bacterium]MBI3114531.1 hypothetical protein [Candidatus Harrisonbacteria bacterium]